jgi:hypothetical protein
MCSARPSSMVAACHKHQAYNFSSGRPTIASTPATCSASEPRQSHIQARQTRSRRKRDGQESGTEPAAWRQGIPTELCTHELSSCPFSCQCFLAAPLLPSKVMLRVQCNAHADYWDGPGSEREKTNYYYAGIYIYEYFKTFQIRSLVKSKERLYWIF